MRIYTRAEWGARYDNGSGPAPLPATEVWLHHGADSAPGHDATVEQEIAYMRADEAVGESRFGKGISYTFVVFASGRIYEGHGVDRRGSHTRGHNTQGRAVKWPGNFERATWRPTPEQIEATARLLVHGRVLGWFTQAQLSGGHRDASGAATACPGANAHARIGDVNARAAELLAAGGEDPDPPTKEADVPEICRSIETNTLWAVTAAGRRAIEGTEGGAKALDVAAFYVQIGWARWGPGGKPRDVPKAWLDTVPRTDEG